MASKPKVLVIDGIIGVGKSEFVKMIDSELGRLTGKNVLTVPEPSEEWEESGMLAEFYKDISGHSLAFQTYTFTTRMRAIKRAIESAPSPPDIIVLERSIFTDRWIFVDMLHESGLFDSYAYRAYCEIWDFLLQTWDPILPVRPTAHILLDAPLKVSMARIKQRARPGEKVDWAYQSALQKKHNEWLLNSKAGIPANTPVYQIDVTDNYITDYAARDAILEKVVQIVDSL